MATPEATTNRRRPPPSHAPRRKPTTRQHRRRPLRHPPSRRSYRRLLRRALLRRLLPPPHRPLHQQPRLRRLQPRQRQGRHPLRQHRPLRRRRHASYRRDLAPVSPHVRQPPALVVLLLVRPFRHPAPRRVARVSCLRAVPPFRRRRVATVFHRRRLADPSAMLVVRAPVVVRHAVVRPDAWVGSRRRASGVRPRERRVPANGRVRRVHARVVAVVRVLVDKSVDHRVVVQGHAPAVNAAARARRLANNAAKTWSSCRH